MKLLEFLFYLVMSWVLIGVSIAMFGFIVRLVWWAFMVGWEVL